MWNNQIDQNCYNIIRPYIIIDKLKSTKKAKKHFYIKKAKSVEKPPMQTKRLKAPLRHAVLAFVYWMELHFWSHYIDYYTKPI